MMEQPAHRILTVPEEVRESAAPECTGNEFVSLPEITCKDGAVHSINMIHLSSRGLVEFSGASGAPLLVPDIQVNGLPMGDLSESWSRIGDWIPRFRSCAGDAIIEGTLVAPIGCKGFFYLFEAQAQNAGCRVRLGVRGAFGQCSHVIFTRKHMHTERYARFSKWTRGLILEARAGLPLAAIALSSSEPLENVEVATDKGPFRDLTGEQIGESGDVPIRFRMGREFELGSGEKATIAFYVSVNLEGDGAGTGGVDMARHGWRALLDNTVRWMESHRIAHTDPALGRVLNRNLLFCYFYAFGRSVDGEHLVPVTSRSPRYYVSAAFWARDTLLWAFPALLMVDPAEARELLAIVFTRYLKNAGIHALYIDGTVLYPGFELDELAAYIIALERYIRETGDEAFLHTPAIQEGLSCVEDRLWGNRHPEKTIFSTFLHPSDDPIVYPYLTYDNALALKAIRFLAQYHERAGRLDRAHRCRAAAEQLYETIGTELIADGPFGPMYVWSSDLAGNHLFYDDAPGGLQLLAYYGLCDREDPVYQNTVKWAYSHHNPYFYNDGAFRENGCEHAHHPWLLHAANSLLGIRPDEAEDLIRRAKLDNGLVCETVERHTGKVATGAAFATCAGFIAFALHAADQRRKQRSAVSG